MSNKILITGRLDSLGLTRKKIEGLCRKVIKSFEFTTEVELSVVFVGVKKAKKLNIEYRKMDYIPQVLGFPNSKDTDPDGLVRLGDVVICSQKLKDEVKLKMNKGKNMQKILEEWLKHGVENLLK